MRRILQSVKWLWSTSWPAYAASVLASNVLGALALMAFLKFLMPLPAVDEFSSAARERLTMIGVGYLIFAVFAGIVVTGCYSSRCCAGKETPTTTTPTWSEIW